MKKLLIYLRNQWQKFIEVKPLKNKTFSGAEYEQGHHHRR